MWNKAGNQRPPVVNILYIKIIKQNQTRSKLGDLIFHCKVCLLENVPKRSENAMKHDETFSSPTLGHTMPLSPTGTCADYQMFIFQD